MEAFEQSLSSVCRCDPFFDHLSEAGEAPEPWRLGSMGAMEQRGLSSIESTASEIAIARANRTEESDDPKTDRSTVREIIESISLVPNVRIDPRHDMI